MADIELVIKIDEEDYKRVLEINNRECEWNNMHSCYEAVLKGTPLPKGHGRLIDADKAIKTLKSLGNRDYRRERGTIQEAEKMLSYDDYTPTIIEADKEEQHE